MNILFSPLGGTDPISENNFYDGSMLHICRHYDIDKVYLYMTKEIYEKHEKDDRYRFFINKLAEQKNKEIESVIIADKERDNVQEYDPFLFKFEEEINNIINELNDDDNFFINISSGTPAMKNALVILQDLNEYNCKFIQVSTPIKKMNEHTHGKVLELELMWEMNMELEKEGNNRCVESKCPSLSRLRKEEIIKKHIDEYDYRAALSVAGDMEKNSTKNYIDELLSAVNRYNLNMKKVDNEYKKEGFDITPVKAGDARKLFEYALWLNIKVKREEYIDFVRGITPIVVELFEVVLKGRGKLDINKYCTLNGYKVRVWDTGKIAKNIPGKDTNIKDIVNKEYKIKHSDKDKVEEFRFGMIYSEALLYLIKNLIDDEVLFDIASNIRTVEEKVRNLAAHDIVALDSNDIKNRTGFTPVQIMDKIKKLFNYTNFGIKPEYWDSYDDMNKELKRRISEHREETTSC
ncbi:hypothetical protein HMPREF0491_02389 [Lachnospiraceae oral taxon 107 str. F0167]|jgi:hypothetical protein|nr:hypothetical protein HMPREF0491_02389 [Lachnospiraceae oral taxon 107 str. F0167]